MENKENNYTPEDFFRFLRENRIAFNTLMAYYECAMMEVETKFRVLDREFSLEYDRNPIETIKSRLKNRDSLAAKLFRKNLPVTMESIEANITDVAGVRIVCSFLDDIYKLADILLQQDDVRLIEKRDYIKHPKPSGYRSLHLIIEIPIFLHNEKRSMKVEVQLRTVAMDCWASLEHKLRYKKDISVEDELVLQNELQECSDLCANLDFKMQSINRHMLQPEETNEE